VRLYVLSALVVKREMIKKYTNMNKIVFNKRLIVIILMFIPLLLFADNKFQIRGKIDGLKDSTLIAVFEDPNAGALISECYSKNGEFEINATVNYSISFIYLGFKGYKPYYQLLLLNNDEIMVKGNVKDIDKLTILGGKYMNDLLQTQKLGIESRLNTITALCKSQIRLSSKEEIKILKHIIILAKSIRNDVMTFIDKKPGSPVSSYLFYKTIDLFESKSEMEKIMNMFAGDAKNTSYYGMLSREFDAYSKHPFSEKEITERIRELHNTPTNKRNETSLTSPSNTASDKDIEALSAKRDEFLNNLVNLDPSSIQEIDSLNNYININKQTVLDNIKITWGVADMQKTDSAIHLIQEGLDCLKSEIIISEATNSKIDDPDSTEMSNLKDFQGIWKFNPPEAGYDSMYKIIKQNLMIEFEYSVKSKKIRIDKSPTVIGFHDNDKDLAKLSDLRNMGQQMYFFESNINAPNDSIKYHRANRPNCSTAFDDIEMVDYEPTNDTVQNKPNYICFNFNGHDCECWQQASNLPNYIVRALKQNSEDWQKAQQLLPQDYMVVRVPKAIINSKPDMPTHIYLLKYDVVEIIEKKGEWLRIKYYIEKNNKDTGKTIEGWIKKSNVR